MRSINILIINGPNINMLGTREIDVYGNSSYHDLIKYIKNIACEKKIKIKIVQSNYEGKIIDYLQKSNKYSGIILNAGAYTHYSYAIRDAIVGTNKPTIEVHLSDIMSRDDFRKISVIKEVCIKQIYGLGFESYKKAIEILMEAINVH